MRGQPAPASRKVDAYVVCNYAGDPQRPDCQHRAVVAYGPVALCADCDRRRSTVGKGMVGRSLVRGRSWSALLAAEAAAGRLADAEAALVEAVSAARAHGHSWGELAIALGVSRQAAQQRFGKELSARQPEGGDAPGPTPGPADIIRRTRSDINA
jgi:hypothetical protein